ASKLDLQSIYELVCEQIRETFGAETAYIAILDPERKEFRVPYYVDQGEHLPSRRLVVRDAAIPLGQGLTSKVYETGQPLLLRTREEQEGALHYQYSDASQDLNESYLGVPIVAGGAVTGVLSVQSHRQSAYGAPHAQLLSTLAGSMSAALENARLFDETQRLLKETEQRAAELAVINSVQAGMASKTDMQGIYELVGEKIREIFDAQSVLLISFDASGTSRTDRYIYEKGQRIQGGEHQEPLSGLNRVLIRERKTLVFNENAAQETEKLGAAVVPGTQPPRSAVFVPLLAGDRVFGTISLQNVDRENAFGESDLRLLNTLAGSMSVALENARLFDEVQRRSKEISEALERQTATSEILRIIAQSPADLQPVLDAVAETAARLCDTYDAQIVRREGDQLRVAGHWGPTDIPDRLTSGFPLDRNSVTGGAILEQRVIHVEDVRALPDSEYPMSQDLSRSMGQRTLLAIPLIEAGEAIGAIIAPRLEVRPFSEQQIALLRTFADQAVIAIRNARLFEQVQRRTEEISEA
ncbi:MAG TPA: GAF domain-containing protein, partial [Anaerolineales bacterium]|nr:GAF domain-containing protein [Anaerolineales bacterium]